MAMSFYHFWSILKSGRIVIKFGEEVCGLTNKSESDKLAQVSVQIFMYHILCDN